MLKAKLRAAIDAQSALVQAAVTAGRALTAEEQTKVGEYETEIKNLEATITAADAAAKRAADANTPAGGIIYAEPKKHGPAWSGMGEFLQAVASASRPGGQIDNRLIRNAATGLSVGVGADGGFTLDADLIAGLDQAMRSEAQVASRIRMIPLGANTNTLRTWGVDETSRVDGSRWGGVQAYWVAEAATATATKPKFRKVEVSLEKLLAICYATDELLQDSTALAAVIRQAYADEMAYKLDDAIINGTGVGQPLGVLSSGALVSVAKETGQPADTILHENVQKMLNRLPARYRRNAVWYINQELEPQFENMTLAIGTAGERSVYAREFSERRTIGGIPVVAIEQCKKLGDKGDIILMDPTQYIGIDKGGVVGEESIHVKFLYDESVFRFIYRFNGAPYRTSAITPANATSGNTLSPFVTLDAR